MENNILCLHLEFPDGADVEYKRLVRSLVTHAVRETLEISGNADYTRLTKTNWTKDEEPTKVIEDME